MALPASPTVTQSLERLRAPGLASPKARLAGKRAAMVCFSAYPADPRPRRAAEALVSEGMTVDYVCLADGKNPARETSNGVTVFRLPIEHRRGGKLTYFSQYLSFIAASSAILARRALADRYDLAFINNMPDVLVASALAPKLLGAKVILDLHDPMPELINTIFALEETSFTVKAIKWLEKWSMARADLVLTVNAACERIFASRSCAREKVRVVMNTPDEKIFPFRSPALTQNRSSRPFVIMYHGTLIERNGLDLAVDALDCIRHQIPKVELKICGKATPYFERVMNRVKEKGLQDSIRYLGAKRLEELVDEIDGCDVGVIPNHRSAFADINTPTRLFEYLTRGKPVIAPRTAGIQDYFDPQSLFFFEAGDSEDLAKQLRLVYSNPLLATTVTRRGQEVYLAHRWTEERETLINLVEGLIAPAKARF